MSQINYHPDYSGTTDGTRYLTINEEGRADVVQHSHIDTSLIHLHADITTGSELNYMLVDISDTVNFNHRYTNYTHLENIFTVVDADNQADYIIQIGYLKEVNGVDGIFTPIYSINGDKNVGRSLEAEWNPYPNGPRLINNSVITNERITSSNYSSATTIECVTGDNVIPGDGDVIMRVIRNAGSFTIKVNFTYHSH